MITPIGPGDWPLIGARRAPDAPCLVTDGDGAMSYAELESASSRLGTALLAVGLRPGDRVAILATDSMQYAALLFAAFKAGLISVPLNFRLTSSELAGLIEIAAPAALFTEGRYLPMLPALTAAAGPQLVLTATLDESPGCASTYASLVAAGRPDACVTSPTGDDDVVMWLLTSGTTGTPRAVMQSQRAIKANTAKGVVEQCFSPEDCLYAGTPLFHVAGMGWLYYAVSRGASLFLLPQFNADRLLRALQDGRVTRCLLVPSMAIALLDHSDAGRSDYASLTSIAYGGAAMPTTVVRRLHETFGCDLYNTFGAGTEAGGQTVLRPADHRAAFAGQPHLLGSIGKAMYGVDVKLCDPGGREVGPGEIGEIYSRSDAIMTGYLSQPELTSNRMADGWVHAGDLAWRDKDGYYYLAGRSDDVIFRGGENIYPAEIENVLAAHPKVAEAAVIGVPDPYWGHTVAAVVTVREPAGASELIEFCRHSLASYKVPQRVIFADELPVNASGKTSKVKLRQFVEAWIAGTEGEQRPAAQAPGDHSPGAP
jgi:acyl-CoA synthetase (AMP-forming)/AMP-acid ligase II